MEDEYEIKVRGKLGPDVGDDKQIRILNRCLHWRKDGLAYEADPRHAEIAIKEMQLGDCKEVATPGTKADPVDEADDPLLVQPWASKYRQVAARLNFLHQDKCDIQYATKEVMRHMSLPRESH